MVVEVGDSVRRLSELARPLLRRLHLHLRQELVLRGGERGVGRALFRARGGAHEASQLGLLEVGEGAPRLGLERFALATGVLLLGETPLLPGLGLRSNVAQSLLRQVYRRLRLLEAHVGLTHPGLEPVVVDFHPGRSLRGRLKDSVNPLEVKLPGPSPDGVEGERLDLLKVGEVLSLNVLDLHLRLGVLLHRGGGRGLEVKLGLLGVLQEEVYLVVEHFHAAEQKLTVRPAADRDVRLHHLHHNLRKIDELDLLLRQPLVPVRGQPDAGQRPTFRKNETVEEHYSVSLLKKKKKENKKKRCSIKYRN
eukprot:Hpha_TRINITY_DN16906_c1_g8::TRINITY_DN16906_c1_g8_i2::g.55257::m.55257